MPKRVPAVKQHDVTDCGAACLASIAAFHGRRLPISRIRQLASTDKRGTNVLGMVDAATSLGFTAKGVKGPFESIARVPLPAIAHVVDVERRLQHYVVVAGVTRSHVIIMDPADGRTHKTAHEDFKTKWSGVLIILVPRDQFESRDDTTSVARRFWRLVRPHRAVLLQALLGAVVYTLLGLSTSIYVQKIIDYVIVDGNGNLLNLMSVIMIALLVVQTFVGASKSIVTLRTGQLIDGRLILGYYTHLLRLPQRFFDTMRIGEITSRVNDAVKIRAFINDVVLDVIVNALVVVFSMALLVAYDVRLALAMLLVLPVYGAIFWLSNRYNRSNARQLMERASDLQAHFVESLGAVTTVKRFGLESYCDTKTETRFVRMLRSIYGAGVANILANNMTQAASRGATIGLLWFGTTLVVQHHMTPGELMSCYALMGYMTGPLASLVGTNRTIQDAVIAADRLFEIMDLELEPSGHSVDLTAERSGDIRFEGVGFRYGSRERVLDGFNLVLPAGRVTAIVGESGSGKSTIASILHCVYPLDAGRVLVGDADLSHLSTDSVRRVIGVVPQQIDLFAGTISENVAVGEFEADVLRIHDICRQLGMTDFVNRLPQGLDTHIGEHGTTLSGGQRQRLAIARALYRRPQILVLDEAASALDSTSEQYVRTVVREYRAAGKTVVIIAHRLSSVMSADNIVVLSRGVVAEQGRHDDLLRRQGEYHRMWREQFPDLDAQSEAAD